MIVESILIDERSSEKFQTTFFARNKVEMRECGIGQSCVGALIASLSNGLGLNAEKVV